MFNFGNYGIIAIVGLSLFGFASAGSTVQPTSGNAVGTGSGGLSATIQPIIVAPKPLVPLYIQNSGWCLYAKKVDNSYAVEFAKIADIARQQLWQVREDGRIMHKEFNQCVSMTEAGAMSLCGCDDGRANMWDINWERGIFKEKRWNKVIGLKDSKIFLRDYVDNLNDPTCFWSPYVVNENMEPPKPVEITGTIPPNVPISLQQGERYLTVENQNNQFAMSLTKQPNLFQQQNWMMLPNGLLKNMIHNQCLSGLDATLTFCGCDDSSKVSEWEYNYQKKVFLEKKLRKALAFDNNNVVLRDFVESADTKSMECEAYRYEASAMKSTSAQDDTSANNAARNAMGPLSLFTLAAGLIFTRA
jgi:hypothetical protein